MHQRRRLRLRGSSPRQAIRGQLVRRSATTNTYSPSRSTGSSDAIISFEVSQSGHGVRLDPNTRDGMTRIRGGMAIRSCTRPGSVEAPRSTRRALARCAIPRCGRACDGTGRAASPSGNVGSALMSHEFVDVMRLGPAGRSIASGESTTAVASGQADPLSSGEEPLFAPDVDDLTVGVEPDRDHARFTRVPLDRGQGDRVDLTLDAPRALASRERLAANVHSDGRYAHAEYRPGVGPAGDRDHLDERVVNELVGGSRIGDDRLFAGLLAGSTKRGPLRRGELTRSNASLTSAALSGSRRPIDLRHAVPLRQKPQVATLRRARSRSAMPASSAASRCSRAWAASRSAPTPSDSATSRRAMPASVCDGHGGTGLAEPCPDRVGRRYPKVSVAHRGDDRRQPGGDIASGLVAEQRTDLRHRCAPHGR